MTGSAMRPGIVGEFHKRDKFCPIVDLVVAEDTEVLLQFLVYAFRFSVGLWVEGHGHGRLDA